MPSGPSGPRLRGGQQALAPWAIGESDTRKVARPLTTVFLDSGRLEARERSIIGTLEGCFWDPARTSMELIGTL
jgi:hypothetical protein